MHPAVVAPAAEPRAVPASGGTRRGDAVVATAGIGLGVCVGLGVASARGSLRLPGGELLAIGTVSAMAGTYLCLILLLLISRVPWLEHEVGHDRMVALHRKVAPYSLLLICGHVVFTTLSYAQAASHGFLAEAWTLTTGSRWMLPAAAAFIAMMVLGVISARPIRRRMRYETWWVTHLYFYLAVALSFGHQVVLGQMFVGHPVQIWFWASLYLLVAALILGFRVLAPLVMSLRHRLIVEALVPEADGVVSIYLRGARLDRFKASGGQFFQWRFMTRDWWWQAHPYSLSARPNAKWLRITVKSLGDQSAQLRYVRPGTRVVVEGPYGVFTAAARHGERITAFAAGVGICPIRAVLDDLPHDAAVTVVYRVSGERQAPLQAELEQLVAHRGWSLHLLRGPRGLHPMTPEHLLQIVPRLAESDIYICGPDAFTAAVRDGVRALGVPDPRVHYEAFAY